jgi:hypothetical protein
MIYVQQTSMQIMNETLASQVERLTDQVATLWWSTETSFPELGRVISSREQRAHEQRLSRLLDGLQAGLKQAPTSPASREQLRERILQESFGFIADAFGIESDQLELIRSGGFIEQVERFSIAARRYDPTLSSDDIYQAGRNVSSMNLMQWLLGLPVEVTPAVFAYSMLYPYTDNYLDDPTIPLETKLGFNRRFWKRLAGQNSRAETAQEERIWDLVTMVENQFERSSYPQVYDSLLAIHAAQARSLRLLSSGSSPYEVDVLRISIEKGGTSVLADGYLVAGKLSEDQASFMFKYGAFTQWMDDLEDVDADRNAGSMTIFSQTAGHYPLDAITNRLFHLEKRVFELVDVFPVPQVQTLQELTRRLIPPLLYFSASRFSTCFSPDYLKKLEAHMPLRAGFMRSQEKKMDRSHKALLHFIEERSE